MKIIVPTLLLFALIISCKSKTNQSKAIDNSVVSNLLSNFENELNNLDTDEIVSLDNATKLFQEYASKTNNVQQKDSLFQPYFNFYNHGVNLLKNEPREIITKYGFQKISEINKEYLVPAQSDFLDSNVIAHLSKPMQKFCKQQLKEFTDAHNLETIAHNTIWWDTFNAENPDFFLKEMTTYHYKNWHLKHLISGTESVNVYTSEGKLTEEASNIYKSILQKNTSTQTAGVIKQYMSLLEKSNMYSSKEVLDYIKQLE